MDCPPETIAQPQHKHHRRIAYASNDLSKEINTSAASTPTASFGQTSTNTAMDCLPETKPQPRHKDNRKVAYASNSLSEENEASVASSATGSFTRPGSGSGEHGNRSEEVTEEVSSFEDRMKRWADRKEQKKRKTAMRKDLGLQATNKVGTSLAQDPTSSTQKGTVAGESDVQDFLIQKGLPITNLELVGSGNFARVYKGVRTQDGPDGTRTQFTVAVKRIKSTQARPRIMRDGTPMPPKWLEREVKTNLVQHHENLLRVIETSVDSPPYALVLEYCAGGSLHESIKGDPSTTLHRFTWEHRFKAALDVALGMSHLHSQNIVHRDLKAQNALLFYPVLSPSDPVLAKVCDFGLARYLPDDDIQTRLTHQVGSWYFMAPEMFDSKNLYDGKIDVYSFGVLLYEMLAGDILYASEESQSFAEFVIFTSAGGRPREDAIPEGAPEALRTLMKEAWRAEPSERPTFSRIAERLREEMPVQLSLGGSIRSAFASWFACVCR